MVSEYGRQSPDLTAPAFFPSPTSPTSDRRLESGADTMIELLEIAPQSSTWMTDVAKALNGSMSVACAKTKSGHAVGHGVCDSE